MLVKLARSVSRLASSSVHTHKNEKADGLDGSITLAEELGLSSGDLFGRDSAVSDTADNLLSLWADQEAQELVPLLVEGVRRSVVVCEEWSGQNVGVDVSGDRVDEGTCSGRKSGGGGGGEGGREGGVQGGGGGGKKG